MTSCPTCSRSGFLVDHEGQPCPIEVREQEIAQEHSITFHNPDNQEVIRLEEDGRIFVRDEEVADNRLVYEAMLEFLTTGSTYQTGYAAGYAAGHREGFDEGFDDGSRGRFE